jgi:prepilin-type processing-associated H-X9-DG protein
LTAVVNAPDGVNISSEHPGGANALFADGHVQLLSSSISSQTLHDLTTINGGEPIQGF